MIDIENTIQNVHLVYFSGTGGTRRVANAFQQEISSRGRHLTVNNLDRSHFCKDHCPNENDLPHPDLVILLFALHAFDAPEPVYRWIDETPLTGAKIAVISVSGGGDAWPNTGCREKCCKTLQAKGFDVVYDRMMCMPSNWVFPAPDHAAMWMIKAIPNKVNLILDDLFAGVIRRSRQKKSALRSYITTLENQYAQQFPHDLQIAENCSGCGLCARNCPVNNIKMTDRRPVFHDHCMMCFRCVYACPEKAITTGNFMVLKDGFNLDELEKRMQGVELEAVEKCCPGILWKAVRDYLLIPEK